MADTATKTYRGRSLEALIPRIREELGPDAIVLRSREKLEGGVGGFFQRQVVEVEARAPLAHERDTPRNDRATAEGLATPAVAQLVEQAAPFADSLARAQRDAAGRAQDLLAAHAEALQDAGEVVFEPLPVPVAEAPAPSVDAGLYGPQPNRRALQAAAPDRVPAPAPVEPAPAASLAPALPPAALGGIARPPSAAALEQVLVTAGLSQDLAADVVGEAVAHRLPFAGRSRLPELVRRVLAARIAVLGDVGAAARALAVAGPSGSGKTATVANLAVAYAAAGARVAVLALGDPEDRLPLAQRLEPLGIPVRSASDPAAARRMLDAMDPDLALIDTPGLGRGDAGAVRVIAAQLRVLAVDEVHLALPASLSAAAAAESHAALRPLGITHAVLTHADSTAHPGAAIEAAIGARLPFSYATTRATVEPADPAALAARLV